MNLKLDSPILFVTAHPDDECMFFAPTILHLIKNYKEVHLICLSNGNSEERSQELKKSCHQLQIQSVEIITSIDLLDDINKFWPSEKINDIISQKITKLKCKTIITFDNGGVSGHKNHVSIAIAMKTFNETSNADIYVLKSCNILRKYCIMIDLIVDYFDAAKKTEINIWNNLGGFFGSIRAMLNHRSQLTWYRYLYILTSCYMVHNKLIKL